MRFTFLEIARISLAAALPLYFSIKYFLVVNSSEDPSYLPFSELISSLLKLRSLIAFAEPYESVFTIAISISLGLLIVIHLFKRKPKNAKSKRSFFLFASGFLLLLYFIFPNSSGTAGMVSIRINYMFYLFVSLWLASRTWSIKEIVGPSLVVVISHFCLLASYTNVIYDLNKTAVNIEKFGRFIPSYSTVLPIDLSNHWLMNHFSNYMAVDKPIIILENYETTLSYFPLVMNKSGYPNMLLGDKSMYVNDCFRWDNLSGNVVEPAEFVFILGSSNNAPEECKQHLKSLLGTHYRRVYSNATGELYRKG